jgi:biotin carboxyl carrier protein
MKYVVSIHEKAYQIEILPESNTVLINGEAIPVDFRNVGDQSVYSLLLNGNSHEAIIDSNEQNKWQVLLNGMLYDTEVLDEHIYRMRQASSEGTVGAGEFQLKAPMPGLVLKIPVMVSQEVDKGEILLILESMKMQNELKAPRAGIVTAIRVKPGDSVNQNQVMMVLD